jgi:septum formation protein
MAEAAARALVLASASPYRRQMLEAAGLAVRVAPADIDERTLQRRLVSPDATAVDASLVAVTLARAKALDVSARQPDALVIGADQVLALGEALFSKPGGLDEARRQLLELRGKTHRLHTAVSLAGGGALLWSHIEVATLRMRAFSDAFLDRYLALAGERVRHIVGAYEIEGPGIQLFDYVEGDRFAIIGLPLLPLLAELRTRGALAA